MKIKLFCLILILALCITCVSFVACNDTSDDPPKDNETSTREEETLPPPIELADGDDLSFVLNADKQSYSVLGLFHETGAIRIEIPEEYDGLPVTAICASAFASSAYLESVFVPDTVTHIGHNAFDGCGVLKNVELSKNLVFVGELAFEGCESLELKEYDNALYLGSKSAPYTILIRAADTEIESCTVHNDTKIIYDYAFLECTEIDEITIPDGIIAIGSYVFEDCYDLFPNNAHNGAYYLGNSANPYLVLVDTSGERELDELVIEPATKIIAPGAIEGCSNLTSITIPAGVSYIGQYAFEGCTSLSSVTFESEAWEIIDGEKIHTPITVDSSSDDIAEDLSEIYYYCAWYKQ